LTGAAGRVWLGALAGLAAGLPSLHAQRVWHRSLYPYAYYSSIDGLWLAGHVGVSTPIGFAERPEPHAAALNLDAGTSMQGSYSVVADAQVPALWAGWRLRVTLSAARDNRLGFYGLGNDTPYTADSVTADSPYFYQVSRTYPGARATVQHRLVGPLRVLVGAAITRTDFRPLPGRSVFRQNVASGAVDSTFIPFTDRTVRAGLVLDTRDNELAPHSGLVAEALFASGPGYTRTTGSARVFVRPLERVSLAARVAGEGTSGSPPVATQIEMESSELPFIAVGGYHSLRGYYDARFIGSGKLLGGLEARYAPVLAPTVVEVQIVGFYDVGRVFGPGEPFQVTTNGLHQSGGAEVAVHFLRNTLVVVGVGAGSEGAQFLFGTQWSY
jgi:outer membrane protein assembly factor BamA